MSKEIIISKGCHKSLSFLTTEYVCYFVIDGKRWPSVDHYIQGMRFEGTFFEEIIRTAPTISQLRRIIRPKIRIVVKDGVRCQERVYSVVKNDGVCYPKANYTPEKRKNIMKATRAKFRQNELLKKRLLATDPLKIICDYDKIVGITLEKVRYELSPKKAVVPQPKYKEENDIRVDAQTAHKKYRRCIKKLLRVSRMVMKSEMVKNKLFPDMIMDSIANCVEGDRNIHDYICHTRKIEWTKIFSCMPKFNELVTILRGCVGVYYQKFDISIVDEMETALILALFVKWCSDNNMKSSTILKNEVKYKDIILPKGKRIYRGQNYGLSKVSRVRMPSQKRKKKSNRPTRQTSR